MDVEGKWLRREKNNYFYLSLQSKEEFLIKCNKAFPMGTSVAIKENSWQTCCINVFQELVWMNWYCWSISQEKKKRLKNGTFLTKFSVIK